MRRKPFRKGVAIAMAIVMLPFYMMNSDNNAVAAESKASDVQWELVWSDEFDGDSLDERKWSYRLGGAYNDEEQYYKKENVTVSDGTLKITAKKEAVDKYPYTSGRISTGGNGQDLFATKYGRIEARIKLPEGTGLWPAFWMMPKDSIYGGWPLSGEIDIMEARGRVTDEVNGTLHFGQSGSDKKSLGGSYTFADGTDITDYHVYAIEWSENEIIWFVDDVEFYRTSNWYTMSDDGVLADYPAPFDQEFYIILNLAVGGTYDNYQVPSESELPATMEVDYVRVYHDVTGYSDSNITMPEGTRDDDAMESTPVSEDGNLLSDINFESVNEEILYSSDIDITTHDWYFLTNKYHLGAATLSKSVINGSTFVNIDISDPGPQVYSIMLAQQLPLAKGYVYNVSFDAMCPDGDKTIRVKAYGETNYSSSYKAKLTTEVQSYQFSFIMEQDTDWDAHLEINLGQYEGDVSIGNVKVTVVDTYNKSEPIEEEFDDVIVEPETEGSAESETEFEKEPEMETETEVETETDASDVTEDTTEEETTSDTYEETKGETESETERLLENESSSTNVKKSLKYLLGMLNRWWYSS